VNWIELARSCTGAREYGRALAAVDEMLRDRPGLPNDMAIASAIRRCATVCSDEDHPEEWRREYARRCTGRLRDLHRKACERTATPGERAQLATIKGWLAGCLMDYPAGPEDGREAVALAEQATALSPGDWHPWGTLGFARYRAGDLRGAADALQKSASLGGGNSPFRGFAHAMALWRLGERDAARREYDRAARATDGIWPEHPEFCRYQAEAAELLGILAPPPRRADRP
jgi:hypothetical protein